MRKLEDDLFKGCTALTCISLPSTLNSISGWAFQHCPRLEEVRLPQVPAAGLSSLRSRFPALKRIHLASLDPKRFPEDWDEPLFQGFERLEEIHIPAQVHTVGKAAFQGCPCLERWTVDPANPWLYADGPYLIAREGNILLLAAPGLKGEAVLPEGITEIRSEAFFCNDELTSVTIPSAVRVIQRHAFYYCRKLKQIRFLGAPEQVYQGAFYYSPATKGLVLPKGSRWVRPEKKDQPHE